MESGKNVEKLFKEKKNCLMAKFKLCGLIGINMVCEAISQCSIGSFDQGTRTLKIFEKKIKKKSNFSSA